MSFSYSEPKFLESRNNSAVGGVDLSHMNSGGEYCPFPSKYTKSLGLLPTVTYSPPSPSLPSSVCNFLPSSFTLQMPNILSEPLLDPGSAKLISSPNFGPFSVNHNFSVTGSKSIPKLFFTP